MDKPINSHDDRIEAIFDAALVLASLEQREVYLPKECGSGEPLLTEVRALLLAHDQAHDFLELKPLVRD